MIFKDVLILDFLLTENFLQTTDVLLLFFKFIEKTLESKIQNLYPTDERKSSEKSHGSSYS